MEILFILIPLSLCLVAFALWSFVWSVKNDQFDDLERQGWSILFDDNKNSEKKSEGSGEKADEH
jgi:cbb3-type cytochrome oxidase maturation protein